MGKFLNKNSSCSMAVHLGSNYHAMVSLSLPRFVSNSARSNGLAALGAEERDKD